MPLDQNDPFVQEALKQGVPPADIEAYLAHDQEQKQHETQAAQEVNTQAAANPMEAQPANLDNAALVWGANHLAGTHPLGLAERGLELYGGYKAAQALLGRGKPPTPPTPPGPGGGVPVETPVEPPVEAPPRSNGPPKLKVITNPNPPGQALPESPPGRVAMQNAVPRGAVASGGAMPPQTGGPAAQEGANFLENLAKKYGPAVGKIGTAIADNPIMRGVGQVARVAGSAPVMGAQMALTPTNTGPAVPSTGRLRGSEINPFTHAPWTPEALQAYNANPQKYDAQLPGPVAPR